MTEHVSKLIQENDVRYVDLRFTDLLGKEHHVTLPASKIDEEFFQYGKAFDGSSIRGWQDINHSDLILIPDPKTAVLDLFPEVPTLNITCDVFDPILKKPYSRDPRGVTRRAEEYLSSLGIADACYFGQEVEFFIFYF